MAWELNQRPKVEDESMGFNQFNVDSKRASLGLGSNACLSIVGEVCTAALKNPAEIMQFLLRRQSLKQLTLDCVRKWDERPDTRALEPMKYIPAVLQAAGLKTLRHNMVLLASHDRERFAHILCANPHPFVIAVTAQLRSDSLRADGVSDTFALVAAGGRFALHDSHIGRTIVVHGCDMQAAQVMMSFVFESVLPELSCVGSQLELIVCDAGVQLSNNHPDTMATLCSRKGCRPEFLQAFVQVGRKIMAKWSCSHHECGDVACTSWEYHRLKAKWVSQQHLMPHWFLGSLFFYLHSWRFSDCMHTFVSGCIEDDTLWLDQDESSLELALQASLPRICEASNDIFKTLVDVCDPRFIIEKMSVPENILSHSGGYEFGPSSWLHNQFRFAEVGDLVCKLLEPPDYVDKNFSKICQDLQKVFMTMPHKGRLDGQDNYSYLLTNKLHTYITSEGRAGGSVGFCGGMNELSMNSTMWTWLGSPSPEECLFIFGCRMSPFECGFHMACVGQVWSAFLGSDGTVDESALCVLLNDLDTLHPSVPETQDKSKGMRADTLAHWADMTWHSPLDKLELAKTSRQRQVECYGQKSDHQAGS